MPRARPYESKRLLDRLYGSVYFWPVIAIPIGGGLAIIAASVDNTVLLDVGVYPRFSTANVRALFAAVAGATITVTAVLFWIRATLIQLASSRLSDRILRLYLEDRPAGDRHG